MSAKESVIRRALALGLLSLTVPGPGSMVAAQDACGCSRLIPYEGQYNVAFDEKVGQRDVGTANISTEDVAGTPGARILGANAGSAGSLSLECLPGGIYVGFMQPRSQPAEAEMTGGVIGAMSGAYTLVNGDVPMGLRMTNSFDVRVVRPPEAQFANEVMVPELVFTRSGGDGDVPEWMCERAEQKIGVNQRYIDAYSDLELLAEVERDKRPALTADPEKYSDYEFQPSPTGAAEDEYFAGSERVSYRNILLRRHIDENVQEGALEIGRSVASMDIVSCKINAPDDRESPTQCRLGVEIDAAMIHELNHQATCLELNKQHGTLGYARWVNHPSNLALTERDAHTDGMAVLQAWHDTHCGD